MDISSVLSNDELLDNLLVELNKTYTHKGIRFVWINNKIYEISHSKIKELTHLEILTYYLEP